MSEKRVNLNSARHDTQRLVMETIVEDDVCPFCPDNLHKYHTQPILAQGEHWLVTTNQWPYDHTDHHFLLIATRHIQTITDVPPGGFEELGEHVKNLIRDYDLTYGGLAMRFGEITLTGASVNHLHAHVLQAARDLPEGEKVRFKFSR